MDPIATGHREFTFPNEDKYVGQFSAHRSGLAWREGFGLYFTHDGHIYACEWKDDKIDESQEVEILYPNDDRYIGKIQKFKYQGAGSYIFVNGSRLTANFAQNVPVGDVIYVDTHGECWKGTAGPTEVLLFQEHVFSKALGEDLGKGEPRTKPKLEFDGLDELEEGNTMSLHEMEKRIFAKSTRTLSDINFKDSDWYKSFLIRSKADLNLESLKEKERSWYLNYMEQQAELQKLLTDNQFRSQSSLLRIYFNTNRDKNVSTPIRVFYPTPLYSDA